MAAHEGSKERIAYLLGLEDTPRYTPDTLTKRIHAPGCVYSYDLMIVQRASFGYWVHPRDSTPTTNRHISACCMVLADHGYERTGTDDRGWSIFTNS